MCTCVRVRATVQYIVVPHRGKTCLIPLLNVSKAFAQRTKHMEMRKINKSVNREKNNLVERIEIRQPILWIDMKHMVIVIITVSL